MSGCFYNKKSGTAEVYSFCLLKETKAVFCLLQFSHAQNEKADRADLSAKGWIFILWNGRNAHSATDRSCFSSG
jgi:hypothetical protein